MLQKNFYLSKRGRVWYARLRDPKTREIKGQVSTGQTNRTRAEQWAQAEYDKAESKAGTSKADYRAWIDRFYTTNCPHISTLTDKNRTIGDSTIKQNRKYIEKVILHDQICDIHMGEIGRADVLDFKDRIIALKGRTRTAQMIFSIFCTSLKEAVERGLLDVSPASGVPKIAYQEQTRRALAFPDIMRILDPKYWDDFNAWRGVKTAAFTGMRTGEVCGLQWQWVDNPKDRITICNNRPARLGKDKDPKWGKTRVTIYPKQVREILEPLRQDTGYVFAVDGGPMPYDMIHDALDRACIRAEVRATMHQLRHSLQTKLRGDGLPDDLLRGMFGWVDESTQDNYTHRELYDLTPLETAVSELV